MPPRIRPRPRLVLPARLTLGRSFQLLKESVEETREEMRQHRQSNSASTANYNYAMAMISTLELTMKNKLHVEDKRHTPRCGIPRIHDVKPKTR